MIDKTKVRTREQLVQELKEIVEIFASIGQEQDKQFEKFDQFVALLGDLNEAKNPDNQGALKVLHDRSEARDFDLQEARISKEIDG